MALLRSVLGTITQSMGGVTATTWKGKNVLKQKVSETNTSNSPAQAKQRRKFAVLAKLAGLFGTNIRYGYRVAAAQVTEQNAFYTANQDAVTDDGTTAIVDMGMLKLSQGTVAPVVGLNVTFAATNGEVSVAFTDNSNGADALPTDLLFLGVYNSLTGQVYNIDGVTMRTEGPAVHELPELIGAAAANIRVYAFFKRQFSTAASPTSNAVAHV